MATSDVETLYRCIEVLEAQEILVALKIHDWPTMKDTARQTFHNTLNKLANPTIIKAEARAITTKDLAAMLNGGF